MATPNVLWITCDELGAAELAACRAAGLRLPAFERLEREGVSFEACHVQMPKCIPMRGMFLSGRYAHVDGLRTMSRGPFRRGDFLLPGAEDPSLLGELRAAGYRLAIAGPNHVLRAEDAERIFEPLPAGRAVELPVYGEHVALWERAYFAGRVADTYDPESFADSVAVERMRAWLAAKDERPFCGLVDIREPHPPYKEWPGLVDHIPLADVPLPPRPPIDELSQPLRAWRNSHDIEALDDDARRRIRRAHWSQIVRADSLVGRLLDSLDELGIADETLVVLGSDHGDFVGRYGCYEKWDTALSDCLTHVPLLMRLPGELPTGRGVPGLCQGIDIAPTICELLGRAVPAWMHGRSLLPQIAGGPGREVVFAQGGVEPEAIRDPGRDYVERLAPCYHGKQRTLIEHPEALLRAHMVRSERCKLIRRHSGAHEFYDLARDPHELDNRIDDPAYVSERCALERHLLDFFCRYQNDRPMIHEIWA